MTKWLETLQQESWQLELIISGFAIFLLLGAYEPIVNLKFTIKRLVVGDNIYNLLGIPYNILRATYFIFVTNLIVHVLLRGLWISTIGLRYVSGDIDFEQLKLSPKFDQYLKKRIGSFDSYIEKLEKICSVVFAFTFLIVFALIASGLCLMSLIGIGFLIDWVDDEVGEAAVLPFVIFMLLFLFSAVLYLLDFVTLGWLKRQKWLSKVYYPIYRLFSVLTLSFIYRPIYYNLIDNKFGRWSSFLLIPYGIVFFVFSTLTISTHEFLPSRRQAQTLSTSRYDDIRSENSVSTSASIPSKFVDNGFLQLYLPYVDSENDRVIQTICPDLEPAQTGIRLETQSDRQRYNMNADSALLCNAQRYNIYVDDSLMNDLKYRFYHHPTRKDIGLITIFDVDYLERGEHEVRVDVQFIRRRNRRDTLIFIPTVSIPFWKE
ncbi:MAG: hypothetical protein AAGJ18_06315 [Bacteroidota bacterium]